MKSCRSAAGPPPVVDGTPSYLPMQKVLKTVARISSGAMCSPRSRCIASRASPRRYARTSAGAVAAEFMKSPSARSAVVSSAACRCVTICLAATVPATVSTSLVRRSVSATSSVPSVAEIPSTGSPTSASRPAGTGPASILFTATRWGSERARSRRSRSCRCSPVSASRTIRTMSARSMD